MNLSYPVRFELTPEQLEEMKQTPSNVLIDICAYCPAHLPLWIACNEELKNRLCK